MRTLLQLLLLAAMILIPLNAQDLPKGMTDAEKLIVKTYTPPQWYEGFVTPPSRPVRTMAEWEPLRGIIITWTSYTSILRQIVDYAQDEGLVYIVCSDSNSVKSSLTSGGVPLVNLRFLIAPFNSIWVRDYGPWAVYADDVDSMYLVDWVYNRPRPADDVIPGAFATQQGIPLYQMTSGVNSLVNTGGNFMTDGFGTGFASKLILTDNPTKTEAQIDTLMRQFMGINRYIKMNSLPYDGIHHIDMHMKLLDEETLLVGQYPQGVSDGPYIEANLQYVLNNFLSVYGRPYKVVRIPMPPDVGGLYPSNGGNYRTYTNSLIVNKTVLVPTYDPQYDSTALRIYREAMPGYRVVGINSNQIIPASGAIHCITKEIGVSDPVLMYHAPIVTTIPGETGGYLVTATIKSVQPVTSAQLFWTADTTLGFQAVTMEAGLGGAYTAEIPVHAIGTKIYYYLSASTNSRTVTKPMTAPAGFYRFTVDSEIPVELPIFSATVSGQQVRLEWTTMTETNNKGFEIERKLNGIWKNIGFVPGKGTTLTQMSYSYTDRPGSGSIAYRLVQVDFDGRRTSMPEIEVIVNPAEFQLHQNYPNPFNPVTSVRFSVPERSNLSIAVYDITGNRVATLAEGVYEAGEHAVTFDATGMASGIYLCRMQSSAGVFTRKMTVLK